MSRDRAPRPHRFAALALAICVAWAGMVAPAPSRDGSFAFAAPGLRKRAPVRLRAGRTANAGPDAKTPKHLKVSAKPAKRGGALRLFQPDALPLANGPVVGGGTGYLPMPTYTALRTDAEAVMSQLPPETHFYIGVGRSPTALVTFLSLLAPDGAMLFPASGLRGGVAPQHVAEFDRHIEALIPPEAFTSGKTIVLMDTVSGGGSLRAMRDRLAAYSLAKYGKPVNMALLGLGGTADGITHVVKSTEFLSAGKDDIAPYLGEHHIGRDTLERLPGKVNPKHADFRSALEQRIIRDGALDSFIAAGYRRVAKLGPSVRLVGVMVQTGVADGNPGKIEDFKALLAAEIASQNVQTTRAGAELRIAVSHDAVTKRSVVGSNLPTLSPTLTQHLARLFYDVPNAPPYDLDIRAKLDANGAVVDSKSIVVTRRVANAKLHKAMKPTGPAVSLAIDRDRVPPDATAIAQDTIVKLLGPITWNAAPGAKVRVVMTPTPGGVVVRSNVDAAWLAAVREPNNLAKFGPLMAGPGNGKDQAIEIEATLGKDGRISTRDAVIITRQDIAVSPREFRRKPKRIALSHSPPSMPPARAQTEIKAHLSSAFANIIVAGGEPVTAHISLRETPDYGGPTIEGFTTLPASLQAIIETQQMRDLIASVAPRDDDGRSPDVDIAIKFEADGKLAAQGPIEITFPVRQLALKRLKRVETQGSSRYSGAARLSKAEATTRLRERLARNVSGIRIVGGAGPVVIEITRTNDLASRSAGSNYIYKFASDLPPGTLSWNGNDSDESLETLYGATNWDDNGDQAVPGTLRIEIQVDKSGRPLVDDSMRLTKVARRFEFPNERHNVLVGRKYVIDAAEGLAAKVAQGIASAWQHQAFEGGANRALTVTYTATIKPDLGLKFDVQSNLPPDLLHELTVSSDRAVTELGSMLARLALNDQGLPGAPITMTIQLDGKGRIAGQASVRVEVAK